MGLDPRVASPVCPDRWTGMEAESDYHKRSVEGLKYSLKQFGGTLRINRSLFIESPY